MPFFFFNIDFSIHEWEAGLVGGGFICLHAPKSVCLFTETSLQHILLFLNSSDSVVLLI